MDDYFSKKSCVGCCIDVKKLERIVLAELKSIIESHNVKDEVKSKVVFEERIQNEIDILNQNVEDYKKKIDECTLAIKNLYMDKVKNIITVDEFIAFSKEFHQDKEKYQEIIENTETSIDELKLKLSSSLDKEELLKKYQDIDHLKRIHVDSLIDYIEIGKCKPKTRKREINIYWNF